MLRKTTLLSVRTVKTLHTPIYDGRKLGTRQNLLTYIGLLEKITNAASFNKSLLYTGKYKKLPQVISGNDAVQMEHMVKEFLTSLQLSEAMNSQQQRDPANKLGKIGLQLFMDCHQDNVTALSTSITRRLMEYWHRCPTPEMITAIESSLLKVREYLENNKLVLQDPRDIDQLVEKIASSPENADAIRKVLTELNYKLISDDVVRVTRGRRREDEIEISKGWKYPSGVLDTNEGYIRSLELPKNKLVALNTPSLVLVHDGTLREANTILPSLHYAAKKQQPLVIVVNGDCIGDALVAITINNNKNRRQGIKSQAIVLRYMARDHKDVQLVENRDFLEFLKLPHGLGSVYSPKFSEHVPSSASASQFFGSIESLKATTGEAFLYNTQLPGQEIHNEALRTTISLHVGGNSEFEIDHRRAELDHVINNVLCHGLAQGWIPSQGIALAKSITALESVPSHDASFLGNEAVTDSLTFPLHTAMTNLYATNKYEASKLMAETIADPSFTTAYLPKECSVVSRGLLEPWNKIDKTLTGATSFLKLIASCDVLVTKIFDKPKKE